MYKKDVTLKVGIYIEVVKAINHTGISRYVKRLVETLSELVDTSVTFYLYYQLKPGERKLAWLADKKNIILRPVWTPVDLVGERPRIWWSYYLPLVLKLDNIDIFHGPNHFVPLRGSIPTIVTIHDIAYYFMNVHGQGMDSFLKHWTDLNLKRATKICAVSFSTAEDIKAQGIPDDKLSVIYQGYEPRPAKISNSQIDNLQNLGINSPYILFVGTIQPRKNVEYIVSEFSKISSKIPHNLILAGAPGDSYSIVKELIVKLDLQNRVTLTGFISDDARNYLYENADLFLYPSLYEGFGLVILEAMSFGVPVITGNNSSMPEAAGNAAILVDITIDGALAKEIENVLNNKPLKEEMVKKGLEHCQSFTWEDSANNMLSLYYDVYRKNKFKIGME